MPLMTDTASFIINGAERVINSQLVMGPSCYYKNEVDKSGRNIKQTAQNTIKLAPGQHTVSVTLGGKEIYSHKVFLSTGETKIIEL